MANISRLILQNKTVLVTGGAGFIGSHLVDRLMQRGCKVRVLDNLANGRVENISHHFDNDRFEFFQGSITDPFYVKKAIEGVDVIFHLACLGVRHSIRQPFENHRVNAEGTLLLLEAALNEGVQRFIYCSTSEVYGTAEIVPMTETHPTHPMTVYGASKLAGEAYARAYHRTYGLETVVIRPFNTYGPRSHHEGDAGELIPKSIIRAFNNEPLLLFGNGEQTRDFTYVEDSAAGLMLAAETPNIVGQTFNLGSKFEITIREVAEAIKRKTGSRSKIEYLSDRPGDVLRLYADNAAYKSLTDWTPTTPFEEGLEKTIQWFQEQPLGAAAMLQQEKALNWV
jgi:UDP-glucose 4-epimerase